MINQISRLNKLKGIKRLRVNTEISKNILEIDFKKEFPGVSLFFIENQEQGTSEKWISHFVLLGAEKFENQPDALSYSLETVSRIIKKISSSTSNNIEVGIQELECGIGKYYQILLYILEDLKDEQD